jgi:hypothetical protein
LQCTHGMWYNAVVASAGDARRTHPQKNPSRTSLSYPTDHLPGTTTPAGVATELDRLDGFWMASHSWHGIGSASRPRATSHTTAASPIRNHKPLVMDPSPPITRCDRPDTTITTREAVLERSVVLMASIYRLCDIHNQPVMARHNRSSRATIRQVPWRTTASATGRPTRTRRS